MTYEEYENRVKELFLAKGNKKVKQEILAENKNQIIFVYEDELCYYYDIRGINCFSDDWLLRNIVCKLEHNLKEKLYPEVYESVLEEPVNYPMTCNEFKQRVKELCIFYAHESKTNEIIEYFNSNENEELLKEEYVICCSSYLKKRRDVFEDYVLVNKTVWLLQQLEGW